MKRKLISLLIGTAVLIQSGTACAEELFPEDLPACSEEAYVTLTDEDGQTLLSDEVTFAPDMDDRSGTDNDGMLQEMYTDIMIGDEETWMQDESEAACDLAGSDLQDQGAEPVMVEQQGIEAAVTEEPEGMEIWQDLLEDPEEEPGAFDSAEEEPEEIEIVFEVELEEAIHVTGEAGGGLMLFSLRDYDGCFGNQLDGLARSFYDRRVDYYVNRRQTGALQLSYTLESCPLIFDARTTETVSTDDEGNQYVEKTLDTGTQEYKDWYAEVQFAQQSSVDAFFYDHPEIFWIRSGKYVVSVGAKQVSGQWKGYLKSITITPSEIYAGASSLMSAYDSAVVQVAENIRAGADRNNDGSIAQIELVNAIDDYLCERFFYDSDSLGTYASTLDYRIFCSGGAFLDAIGTGVVCEGYAKAYKVLCDYFGIPCVLIGGVVNPDSSSREGHMWNANCLDGKWYLVDCTWNDKGSYSNKVYFEVAVPDSAKRISNGIFSGLDADKTTSFVYPVLEDSDYFCCDILGHSNGRLDHQTAADCVNDGTGYFTDCLRCGSDYSAVAQKALGHDFVRSEEFSRNETCTEDGILYTICSRCGSKKEDVISAGHNYRTVVTPVSCTSDGYTTYSCTRCQNQEIRDRITKTGHSFQEGKCIRCGIGDSIANARISMVSETVWTGEVQTPAVTVFFGDHVLVSGTDYLVSYKNNINAGTASAVVTGTGIYSGTGEMTWKILPRSLNDVKILPIKDQTYSGKWIKPDVVVTYGSIGLKHKTDYTLSRTDHKYVGRAAITVKGQGNFTGSRTIYFKINPKPVEITSLTSPKAGQLKVKWAKRSPGNGYQLKYWLSGNSKNAKTVTIRSKSTVSRLLTNLKKGKIYYVKVRAFKTVNGVKYYSSWSSKKKCRVKKL